MDRMKKTHGLVELAVVDHWFNTTTKCWIPTLLKIINISNVPTYILYVYAINTDLMIT